MTFQKDFTEEQRTTLAAAFAIIHDAMIEAGEDIIMLTSELDTVPGEPNEVLISHFVRGSSASELMKRGFITDSPLQ